MGEPGEDDLESMSHARLDEAGRSELLGAQTECSFVFRRDDGWPDGVIMNYLMEDGRFFLTSVGNRAQVRAVDADDRVTIVVSSAGTRLKARQMVAIRGRALVHHEGAVLDRWLDIFSAQLRPEDPAEMRRLLDSPNRVVLEVRPVAVSVSHDHRKITRVRNPCPDR